MPWLVRSSRNGSRMVTRNWQVGLVALEDDAEAADERGGQHYVTQRVAAFALLFSGQRLGHGWQTSVID
jgi:hypothetical protein